MKPIYACFGIFSLDFITWKYVHLIIPAKPFYFSFFLLIKKVSICLYQLMICFVTYAFFELHEIAENI